jgi:hypothetical protein
MLDEFKRAAILFGGLFLLGYTVLLIVKAALGRVGWSAAVIPSIASTVLIAVVWSVASTDTPPASGGTSEPDSGLPEGGSGPAG